MSSPSRTEGGRKIAAAVLVSAALLGGCSDIYYDRRETVALGADDHIASNMATQMVDPWPRYVGDTSAPLSSVGGLIQRFLTVITWTWNLVIGLWLLLRSAPSPVQS